MKKSKAMLSLALFVVLAAVFMLCVSAVDDVVWGFDKESDKDLFGSYRQITVDSIKDGSLNVTLNGKTANGDDPAFFSKGVEIDTAAYNQIIVKAKINITTAADGDSAKMTIYFRTTDNDKFSEALTKRVDIKKANDGFVEYVFNMGESPSWTGTMTAFFLSFHDNPKGNVSIDSITFTKDSTIQQDVVVEQERKPGLTDGEKIVDIPTPERVTQPSPFHKDKAFAAGTFSDVSLSDWFYKEVASAYEFSLVNGKSDAAFDPNGTMTVAEAITLASRMHSIYAGDNEAFSTAGGNWYDVYVEYAKSNGILKDGQFDSYTRAIVRHEMVSLFVAALPADYYTAINYVTAIPDVTPGASYWKDLLLFYNAGIAMGNDLYGNFNPDSNIKRSEVAAIVARIADPASRIEKTLAVKSSGNAYYLIDDSSFSARTTLKPILQSGWDFDNRGGVPKTEDLPPYVLNDISDTMGTALIRKVNPQDSGIVTLETSFTLASGPDGFYIELKSSDGAVVYKLYTDQNAFYLLSDGAAQAVGAEAKIKAYGVKVILDMEKGMAETVIDNVSYGAKPFASDSILDISELVLGTDDEHLINVTPGVVKLYCNYIVNEELNRTPSGSTPYDWVSETKNGATVQAYSGELVYQTSGEAGSAAAMKKEFSAVSGEIVYEAVFMMPTAAAGAEFTIGSGQKTAVRFATTATDFVANGQTLRSYTGNMWYLLRIEADTDKQQALIKVNGKKLGTLPFLEAVSSLDNIAITFASETSAKLQADMVKVFKVLESDNYVPVPVIPENDDYYVGINVCNLWRNGYHWGWDNISPFAEQKPYLGYYDEGLPEVADWEIKWMSEHGIDFQMLCWYHSSSRPIKYFEGSTPEALLDGFFNAKYSDMSNFAILWEAANGARPSNSADFRDYFVPYWVEYFLSDSRYMRIDNKAVIAVFGYSDLAKAFGGNEANAAEFDYVRQICKDLGYDGAIFLACSGSMSDSELQSIKEMGYDGIYAYNWGKNGASAAATQNNISTQQSLNRIHVVPTISTGFNNVAWAGTRSENISLANFEQIITWVKNDALLKSDDDEAWKRKFVMFSTWNEYGEGTYIMPSGLNGFGYLDLIRNAFTKGGAHTDVRPDNEQLARIDLLYPVNRAIIRQQHREQSEIPLPTKEILKIAFAQGDTIASNVSFGNVETSYAKDGVVYGTAKNTDPILNWKDDINLDLSGVTHIKVRVSGPVGSNVRIYFTTDKDSAVNENKAGTVSITQDGLADYYISYAANSSFSGTLKKLRIDPIDTDADFAIESITLMGPEGVKTLSVNGVQEKLNITPISENGELLIPFEPDSCIMLHMNAFYEWNKINKTFGIYANNRFAIFTMGSNVANVNGNYVVLDCTPRLVDGIPMLPIHTVSEALGFTFADTGDSYEITTPFSQYFGIMTGRVENEWEFNLVGDMEGWSFSNCVASVDADGTVHGTATQKQDGTFDPILSSPSLNVDASKFGKIVVRMKHNIVTEITDDNVKKANIGIYFTTASQGLAESRSVHLMLDQTSKDEFIEYTFDMSANKDWGGMIKSIRVDPFDLDGEFWIDSIRFVEN